MKFSRALWLIAVLLTLATVLAVSSFSADTVVLPEHALDSLPADGRAMLDDFNGTFDFWQSPNNVHFYSWYVSGYGAALFCTPGDGDTVVLKRTFAAPVSLRAVRDLLLYLETSHPIELTLTLETTNGIFSFSEDITPGAPRILDADITGITANLSALYITAIPTDEPLTELRLLSIRTDTFGCRETVRRFGSTDITVTGGTAVFTPSELRIVPTEPTPRIQIAGCADTIPSSALFRIVIDSAESGGAMVLSMLDENGAAVRCGSVTLNEGRHVYLLPVALRGSPYTCIIQVLSPGMRPFRLESVSFLTLDTISADVSRGSLTLCQLSADGETLTVSGKLTTEAAAASIGGKILLFELDNVGHYDKTAPIAETAVSIRFSFSLPAESLRISSSSYLAVIEQTDGTLLPLGESWYAAGKTEDTADVSVVGLAGASPADVLLSNTSRVIVDVLLDRLIGGAEGAVSGTLCSWEGHYYDLDSRYLRELDDEIEFYRAAGLRVYLRFLSGSDLSARALTLTGPSDAVYYALNATTTEGQTLLAALSHYLAERYSSIAGVIVGYAIDDPHFSAAACGTGIYLTNYATAVRIIARAMLPYHPSLDFYVPITGNDGDELEDGLSLTVSLSQMLARHGGISYSLLYVTGSTAAAEENERFFVSRLASAGYSFSFASYLSGAEAVSYNDFAALCENARGRYTAVFLSAGAIRENDFFTRMKALLEDGKTRFVETKDALTEFSAFTGTYPLWDFTTTFDALGWISDGTFDSPRTAVSRELADFLGRTSCRALQTTSAAVSKDAVLLCLADKTLLLADAPYITLTLRATGSTNDVWLTVLFGSGDTHTEYRCRLQNGVSTTVTCPLADTAALQGIDYVAVSGESGIQSLEIASVIAGSTTKTDTELAVLLGGETADDPVHPNRYVVYILLALAAALTVIILLFLGRRTVKSTMPSAKH